ncbi:hypothetical protein M885DRAFT_130127 [Pelagophyceae sp. CCMP2097]|nr:hypothetical protein M885DRAFT_130127 [Pelagophyceae sp. CCMP2097]
MRALGPRTALARRFAPVRWFATRGQMAEAALVVRNLPKEATADDVFKAFEPFCDVKSVKLDGAKGQGVAIVTVETAELETVRDDMNGATVGGRKIVVELAPSAAPPRKASTNRPQLSGNTGRAVAIALNKQLVSTETAGDVLALFEDNGADYDFMNIATSFHRLGVLGRSFDKSSEPLLHKLVDRATSSIISESSKWSTQGLANACWGIAKIGNVEAPALFAAVAAVASKKIATFNPQHLANTVWAYATAGVAAPALFEAVAAEAPKKIATFTPQDLANTVWAYATAGVAAPALFEAVAAEAPKKIATFTPQNLANTVWAFAKTGVVAPALFEAIAAESSKKIATFTPQHLAMTLSAYATAGVEASALFEAITREKRRRRGERRERP